MFAPLFLGGFFFIKISMNFSGLVLLLYMRGEGMDVVRVVKKAKKGNKEALLQLIMDRKDEYYKLAYTYLGNKEDALDALEDMIVRVYEKIDQLKKDAAFYSWSKTILVNSCKALLRKKRKEVLVDDWNGQLDDQAPSFPCQYQLREQQLELEQLLKELNDQQAEAIKLKYFHDLDYQTIAEITNVSIGTAKSRVFQGLKKLKLQFGGDVDE